MNIYEIFGRNSGYERSKKRAANLGKTLDSYKSFHACYNLLSGNHTKWSNTLKHFVGFVRLALIGLKNGETF